MINMENNEQKGKKKNKIKSDYGENFIPPEGGYGWVICVASALSNLTLIPVISHFGFIYRDKFENIGLSHSAITSILNISNAVGSLSGFLNGPLFRRFSYRQVGIFGSILSTISIFLTASSNNFESFLLTFGVLLAIGGGMSYSANYVVLNVYFKEKRPLASSWAWTITGIGPIIFPYLITYLLEVYGGYGTILIFTAISANSIALSMSYQPVLWHVKKIETRNEQQLKLLNDGNEIKIKSMEGNVCITCSHIMNNYENNENLSGSKYLIQDGKSLIGKEHILHTKAYSKSSDNLTRKFVELPTNYRKLSFNPLEAADPQHFKLENAVICECNRRALQTLITEELKDNISLCSKIVNYFELNLLKDLRFVNILLGLTLALFSELNFLMLTPFFLSDFGLDNNQIAFLTTMPAISDLACRFLIQFIVKKIKWHSRTFFILGLLGIVISRTVIALNPSYLIMCIAFFCLGVGRGFLTIFYGIIIPDHVPLKSLPAASGLNRLLDGIFPLIFGPCIGIIRDYSNSQTSIHFLNSMLIINIISWTAEIFILRRKKKRNPGTNVEPKI